LHFLDPGLRRNDEQRIHQGFSRVLRRVFSCLLLCVLPASGATATRHVDPDTGLLSWKSGEQAFTIELIQVLPDYVRAVYASRGLPQKIIDEVSSYCVFGTIVRNTTAVPLSYRVADWRYITPDGARHRLKTKSEWVQEWRDMGVAFRWSLLAEAQTFAEGDWVQGFTTVKLSPGSRFDLDYSWSQQGRKHLATIKGVRCAPAEAPVR
jgi:hypothetical protein